MKNYIGIYFIALIILYSCTAKTTKRNTEIDEVTKNEIHLLVDKIIDGFAKNESENILSISTAAFKSVVDADLTANIFGSAYQISRDDYVIMDEIYQKNLMKGIQTTILSGKSDKHDYSLAIIPAANEIYISIGYFDVKNIQFGFCFVFVRQEKKWLLNYLNAGILRVGHKDVIDWFEEARNDYEKGYWCNVALKLGIVKQMLDNNKLPFQYINENPVRKEGQEMFVSIKEKMSFPLEIDRIKTQPSIFSIAPRIEGDTLYPVIRYTTKVDIQNKVLLECECNYIHEIINQLYPGIGQNIGRIFYQVFAWPPDNKRDGFSHIFEKKLNI